VRDAVPNRQAATFADRRACENTGSNSEHIAFWAPSQASLQRVNTICRRLGSPYEKLRLLLWLKSCRSPHHRATGGSSSMSSTIGRPRRWFEPWTLESKSSVFLCELIIRTNALVCADDAGKQSHPRTPLPNVGTPPLGGVRGRSMSGSLTTKAY
jgi:hypothetical protein